MRARRGGGQARRDRLHARLGHAARRKGGRRSSIRSTLLIEAFNAKNTGVTVRGETPSGDYFATLSKAQAQIAAGKPPALVSTPWSNINFAVQGLQVLPLEKLGGNELQQVLANYKPEVLPLVTLNRQTVGLPLAFSCPVMYYNNDIMKQAGVDPAQLFKDWASFKTLGAKVRAVTGNPILGLGNNADWEAQSIIQCNGGRVLDDNAKPVWDSPGSGGRDADDRRHQQGRPLPAIDDARKATPRSSAARWRSGWAASPRSAGCPSR